MTELPPLPPDVAQALADGVVITDATPRARILLEGPDARSFVHRMSTQHVEALGPHEARLTCFTDKKGRLVDLALVVGSGAQSVLVIGSEGRAELLDRWLEQFLFVEEVERHDLTSQGRLIWLAGGGAGAALDASVPGASALEPFTSVPAGDRVVLRTFDRVDITGRRVPAFLVWDPGAEMPLPEGLVLEAGPAEALRVAAGEPGAAEVSDRYNPLELALHDAIHWAKGCYIGQEVISRIDNLGKQSRHLLGLLTSEPATVGAPVLAGGQVIGEVTSAAGYRLGELPTALAVLKGAVAEGSRVTCGEGPSAVAAQVVARAAAQAPHD